MKSISTIFFVWFLIFLTIAVFYSCKENPTGSSEEFILSGTIDNWTYGGSIMLKAGVYDSTSLPNSLVLDSCYISSGGYFSLNLKNVHDRYLYPIDFSDSLYFSNVTVNPGNTKSNKCQILTHPIGFFPDGLAFELHNDTGNIGYILRWGMINNSSVFSCFYLYFNQDVSITGTLIYSNFVDTAFYNLSGKRGWNKGVVQVDSLSGNIYKAFVTTTEPPGGRWVAHFYGQQYNSINYPAER